MHLVSFFDAIALIAAQGTQLISDSARLETTLLATARAVRRSFDARLSHLNLNMTQGSLLSLTQDAGSLTQRELAERLYIGKAAVGAFIDGLEQRHLVTRTADPSDRRVWRIEVTSEALPLVDAFNQIDMTLRAELRAGLSRQERRQLADLLLRCEKNALSSARKSTDT
jgi:DNA-binding MarR family transcriptional regulator